LSEAYVRAGRKAEVLDDTVRSWRVSCQGGPDQCHPPTHAQDRSQSRRTADRGVRSDSFRRRRRPLAVPERSQHGVLRLQPAGCQDFRRCARVVLAAGTNGGFTLVHVILSLIGIFTGVVVLIGMFSSNRLSGLTAVFLATTVLTSATGFLFPFDKLLPSHIVGIISLVVLANAILALYVFRLAGSWR
jgi:hypothetical protein